MKKPSAVAEILSINCWGILLVLSDLSCSPLSIKSLKRIPEGMAVMFNPIL